MKAGGNLSILIEELENKGLLSRASLVEQCGMENEKIIDSLEGYNAENGYFSIVLLK